MLKPKFTYYVLPTLIAFYSFYSFADLFIPKEGSALGYHQEDVKKEQRQFPHSVMNSTVKSTLEEIAKNPDYLDEIVLKIYPAVSKSNIIYNIPKNLEKIKKYMAELNGKLPTLEQINQWGPMKDAEGKEIVYKLFGNAVIAFQNIEALKNKIQKDIENKNTDTVDEIADIVGKIRVFEKPEDLVKEYGKVANQWGDKSDVEMAKGDIVSLALAAQQKGKKNIFALSAGDKENVGGSPFDGPKNTVEESLNYSMPQLTLVSILAALGGAYPNPGIFVIPGLEVTRKVKAKENPKDFNEASVYEELPESFKLNLILAPAPDLRPLLKEKFETADKDIKENKKARILSSEKYTTAATPEDKEKILKEEEEAFLKDKGDTGFAKIFENKKIEIRDAYVKENVEYQGSLFNIIKMIIEAAGSLKADDLIFPAFGAGVFFNNIVDVYTQLLNVLKQGGAVPQSIQISVFRPEHEAGFQQVFKK